MPKIRANELSIDVRGGSLQLSIANQYNFLVLVLVLVAAVVVAASQRPSCAMPNPSHQCPCRTSPCLSPPTLTSPGTTMSLRHQHALVWKLALDPRRRILSRRIRTPSRPTRQSQRRCCIARPIAPSFQCHPFPVLINTSFRLRTAPHPFIHSQPDPHLCTQ